MVNLFPDRATNAKLSNNSKLLKVRLLPSRVMFSTVITMENILWEN